MTRNAPLNEVIPAARNQSDLSGPDTSPIEPPTPIPTWTAGFWLQCVGVVIVMVVADVLFFGRESGSAVAAAFVIFIVPSATLLAFLIAWAGRERSARPPTAA